MSFKKENILLTILATLLKDSTKELIKTARKNRTAEYFVDQNDLIHINPCIYQEISAIAIENPKFISFKIKTNFNSK